MNVMDASVSALRAADLKLSVSANNVANVFTPDFKASRAITREQAVGKGVDIYTVKTDHGTDLAEEMVEQLVVSGYAKANGAVIKTSSQMFGTLIDMFG
jgi:flagellar hook protein FlgE